MLLVDFYHILLQSGKKVQCRHDWHQTGQFVTISVFSKLTIPDETWVDANKVSLKIHITHDAGKSLFEKDIVLRGVGNLLPVNL